MTRRLCILLIVLFLVVEASCDLIDTSKTINDSHTLSTHQDSNGTPMVASIEK